MTASENITPSTGMHNAQIMLAMRKIMHEVDSHSRKLMKQYDITVPQVFCLYELAEKGALNVAVLAKNIHLSPSTTVGIVDRLEEKHYVTRIRDTQDRRAVFVEITEDGKRFLCSTPDLLHNRIEERLSALPKAKQNLIADALELLVQLVERQ